MAKKVGFLFEPRESHIQFGYLKEDIEHELLHPKYPNHGKMFKVLVKSYLGKGTIK